MMLSWYSNAKKKPLVLLVILVLCLISTTTFADNITPSGNSSQLTLNKKLKNPDNTILLDMEAGPNLLQDRMGIRVGASGTVYTPSREYGLRVDMAHVQSDTRAEMTKVLLSLGATPWQGGSLIISGGWLNKYDYGDFANVGEKGDNINQLTAGLNLEHTLHAKPQGMMPKITGYLNGVFYQTDSEVVYTGFEETNNATLYEKYLTEYGLGGGKQYEVLAGLTFDWDPVTLSMGAGWRQREFEDFLGHAEKSDDKPKLQTRLTFHDVLGCEIAGHVEWDADYGIFGGELTRRIHGPWVLVARADYVDRSDMPNETQYYFGLRWDIGFAPRKAAPVADKDTKRGNWLKPVSGTGVEHLMVVRQLEKKTLISKIVKSGLTEGVTVDNSGKIRFGNLPPLATIEFINPSSATQAFSINGGTLYVNPDKLPAPAMIFAGLKQTNGKYAIIRLITKKGSTVIVNADSASNLDRLCTDSGSPGDYEGPMKPPELVGMPSMVTGKEGNNFWFVISEDTPVFGEGGRVEWNDNREHREIKIEGKLPPGLHISDDGGSIVGKPEAGSHGAYHVVLVVSNRWGTVRAPFTIRILANEDGECDPFVFTKVSNGKAGVYYESNKVTITGINIKVPISLETSTYGEYRINGGAWKTSKGAVKNGDTVQVKLLSNTTIGQTALGQVKVGKYKAVYEVKTTRRHDE